MISLCLIVKNEEEKLPECLKRFNNIATEMIVVDTGSSDRTMEIARSLGAQVFEMAWENDFSKARNFCISKATQPWIFVIDPDEWLALEQKEKINQIVRNPNLMAAAINSRNYLLDHGYHGFIACSGEFPEEEKGYLGYAITSKIQLFRNHQGFTYNGKVHESIFESLIERVSPESVFHSDIFLHHFGNDPKLMQGRKKRDLYIQIAEQEISENPNDYRAWRELGMELARAHRFEEAVNAFKKALEGPENNPHREDIHYDLGKTYFRMNQLQLALNHLEKSGEKASKNEDGLLLIAMIYLLANRPQTTRSYALEAARLSPTSFKAFRMIGLAETVLQNLPAARIAFEESLRLLPHQQDVRIHLAHTLLNLNAVEEAKAFCESSRMHMDPADEQFLSIQKKIADKSAQV